MRYLLCRLSATPTRTNAAACLMLVDVYDAAPAIVSHAGPPGREDPIAVHILQIMHASLLARMSPRQTAGDGNCTYRAVSLGLYGTENHHPYVRLRTACEMISHPSCYDNTSPACLMSDSRVCTSPFPDLVADALQLVRFAELIHLYAMSSALCIRIQSYIPPAATVGFAASPYSRLVVGRGVRELGGDADVSVMWSMTSLPKRADAFSATHIVLTAQRSQADSHCSGSTTRATEDVQSDATTSESDCTDSYAAVDSDRDVEPDDLPQHSPLMSDSPSVKKETALDESVIVLDASADDDVAEVEHLHSLPNGQFLNTKDVINLLQKPTGTFYVTFAYYARKQRVLRTYA